MKVLTNPIALAALNNALLAARSGPKPRAKTNSRTADKFVIKGFAELFSEVTAIGMFEGRSTNSEVVAAILEALAGHKRSTALLRILKTHIGEDVAERVLAEVPDFDLNACKSPHEFVVRCPPQVRGTIRDGVATATSSDQSAGRITMNRWILDALVSWVKIQRQQYALLSAAIAMDQALIGHEG